MSDAVQPLPFDLAALEATLSAAGLVEGPVTLERIGDGHSNLTYAVTDGARSIVLRRPPLPPFPTGAHDVAREARIQRALAHTPVPVPEILLVDDAQQVMDVAYYVMEHLDGDVATTETPAGLDTPAGRAAIGEALVDTLVALHAVDPADTSLEVRAVPADVGRQLRRFSRMIDAGERGLDGELGTLLDWLLADPPAPQRTALVHGDFRLGNVMLSRDAPARVLAVLDWELASIGDPLRDLGYFLATYAVGGEPLHALTDMSSATLADGYPSRAQLAERYAAATGAELARLDWYVALALWKLAVLFEYQRRRAVKRVGDPYYAQTGLVDGFLTAARTITTGVTS